MVTADAAGPAADRAAGAGAVDPSAPAPSELMEPLDIRALLHPAEHSRLLIALSSSAVVFGVAAMVVYADRGWTVLASVAVIVAAFGGLVWLLLQVTRSRLLGGAIRVSAATLPELEAVFDEVRTRLNYRKHVDVYVRDKVAGGSAMTSYLGTRLILIEGGLVAELLGEGHHAELTYLIGRHVGQLKARHQRLLPIFLVISLVDSLKFLQLFLAPYYRATAKSGDQIAAACCGDLRATTEMMNRLLVGKELGPRLAVKGVLDQAATVRRRWLPRLAQLFMSEPHATNRYLNLLAFFGRVAPEEIQAWQASLDEATARRLTAVLDASPNRRPPRPRLRPASTLLAASASGGLLALSGWLIFGAGLARDFTGGENTFAAEGPATRQASAGQAPAGQAPAGQAAASRQLRARVPTAFQATCTAVSVPVSRAFRGADAEVDCQPGTVGVPDNVSYVHYTKPGLLRDAYAYIAGGLPRGQCPSAPAQHTYSLGSSSKLAGDLACFTGSGQSDLVWTRSRLHILSYAESNSMTSANLFKWWQYNSAP